MKLSTLQKSLALSVCVSGSLFAIAALPLAALRYQPVEVQLQNKPIFESELNAVAGPYLGIAGAFSAAIGGGILGMGGWRSAARRSEAEKAKSSELERNLSAYQAELERIKFSEARLRAANLETFLAPQHTPTAQPALNPAYQATPESVRLLENSASVIQQELPGSEKRSLAVVSSGRSDESQVASGNQAKFASQGILGQVMYQLEEPATQDITIQTTASTTHAVEHPEKASENQLELVLHQLRDLTAQVEGLQAGGSRQAA